MATVYQLKKKYDMTNLECFDIVSFRLEDKDLVNERHIIQKSYDTPWKKIISSRGAFQCNHVIGLKQTCGIKNATLNTAKNS